MTPSALTCCLPALAWHYGQIQSMAHNAISSACQQEASLLLLPHLWAINFFIRLKTIKIFFEKAIFVMKKFEWTTLCPSQSQCLGIFIFIVIKFNIIIIVVIQPKTKKGVIKELIKY